MQYLQQVVLLALYKYVHQPIKMALMILLLLRADTRGRVFHRETLSEYDEREHKAITISVKVFI